ncbi:LysR family transcriptional regulator [Candidatus Paracaedibacter symbiosus]|uniref:LysR family transcriptional regulator n=1 Tax=Candidatus Paracaedibacter symbiosus TaxID=244582 RepID=UPI0005099184|nr:LysR family transcriptional regulator [Candidatus Paracaedibacter symbiosus]
MEWDKIKVFYTVAQEGSFNKASKRLNVTQSAIGRSISILEHSLKTKLFIRNARGVILTEDGETLFHHARNMIIEAENAITAIQQKKNEVSGQLKLTTGFGMASTSLFEHIADFANLYPEVEINLICNDESLDLKTREADISIRNFDSLGGDTLIQTFLTTRTQHLYASPEYLRERGIPKALEDLENHRFISFNNPYRPLPYGKTEWILKIGREENQSPRKPYMVVNSVECLYKAATKNLGIIALSFDSELLKANKLIQILPLVHSPPEKMYIVYPVSLKLVKVVKTLEKFLISRYKTQG